MRVLLVLVTLPLFVVADHALFWRAERHSLRKSIKVRDAKPVEPPKRVLFLGDSITSGFPLSAYLPRSIAPINAGVAGETTDQILARWQTYVPSDYDYVVLGGGTNDIRKSVDQGVAHRVVENFRRMLTPNAIILTIPAETGPFVLPFLSSGPYGLPPFEVNREINLVNEELKKLGVPVIDANLGSPLDRRYAAADGYHLNYRAYKKLARQLAKQIL